MRFWVIFAISFVLFAVGAYLVYPQTPSFVYEGVKYYGEPSALVFTSRKGETISITKTFAEGVWQQIDLHVENDSARVEIDFSQTNMQIYLEKDGIVYQGDFEEAETLAPSSLLPYAKLAKEWYHISSMRNEDFSIVIYLMMSGIFYLALFVFRNTFLVKPREDVPFNATEKMIAMLTTSIMGFTLFINLVLVLQHL